MSRASETRSNLRSMGYTLSGLYREKNAGLRSPSIEVWTGRGPVVMLFDHGIAGFDVFTPVHDGNNIRDTLVALRARIHGPAGP